MTWVSQQVLATLAAHPSGLSREAAARTGSVHGRSLENSLLKLRRLKLVALEDDGRLVVTAAGRAFLDQGKRLTSGPRGKQPGKRLYRGTLRARAWHAMRIKQKFSLGEIIELASRGEERDAESNVGKYVRALVRTGFLAEMRRKKDDTTPTSNGVKRYLLVRDTGPQAPRWLPQRGIVHDPNTEEDHPA